VTVILGIDTATSDAAVAVTREGELIYEESEGPGPEKRPQHSRILLGEIDRAVRAAGGWDEIDRIAVGLGPGSYTGLRIGIATARGLAQGKQLPLAGVSSLAALARGISMTRQGRGREALPVIDAKRSQVFAALHDPDGDLVWGPIVTAPEELAGRLDEAESVKPAPLAAGDGALRFATELEAAGAEVAPPDDEIHRIKARHICALGETVTEASPDRIEPIYLRAPDAKRWLDRDRGEPSA
jgi:tRNA threonylcarbamoyladenosine biosynthesis protein TsaB